jgi:hypothetical protein
VLGEESRRREIAWRKSSGINDDRMWALNDEWKKWNMADRYGFKMPRPRSTCTANICTGATVSTLFSGDVRVSPGIYTGVD